MKKIYVLLLFILAMTVNAHAYSFKVNGLCYLINSDNKSVTVTAESSSYPRYTSLSGSVNIPASVTYGGKTYTVTKIDTGAFMSCTGITSVTIGNSVTSIGQMAFYICSGITSVTIGNSVTTINAQAFVGCTAMKTLTIPSSVTSIGQMAFYGCEKLANIYSKITNPGNVTMGSSVFSNVPTSTCVLHIPKGTLSKYKTASQWKDFTNKVEDQSGALLGDLDGNGVIEVNDVVKLAEIAMGGSMNGVTLSVADIDHNGKIEVNDVVKLAEIAMGS
ncbi:MAG: leucine-rich repeat protein [Muribaculaceae bacterium]|nr:leucine-rich repeat protein [Muribaculaceae bacterium]